MKRRTLCLSSLLILTLGSACGYRLAARGQLPGGARELRIAAPDVGAADDPLLSPALSAALTEAFHRRGVKVRRGAAGPILRVVVQALKLEAVAVGGDRVAGETWRLRIEARLHRGGNTLFRSGLLEHELSAPMSADPGQGQGIRRRVWRVLVRRAAEDLVLRVLAARR